MAITSGLKPLAPRPACRMTFTFQHQRVRSSARIPRIGEFVFTSTGKGPIQAWSQAKAKLDAKSGVTDWRIHDLRRTVATGMQKLGITLQTIEAVLWVGGRAGYLYSVIFEGNLIVDRSRDPECDAARALVAMGLTGKLTILDGKTGGPRAIIDIETAAKLATRGRMRQPTPILRRPESGDGGRPAPKRMGGSH